MGLRRTASRILIILALVSGPAISGCGAQKPARSPGPAAKIEALREQQEKAQGQIDAEGRARAQEARREQKATLAEAEREREDSARPLR